MRRLLVALFMLFSVTPRLSAQTGIVTADARERLTRTWDTRDSAIERLYCVTHWALGNDGFVYVLRAQPAIIVNAGPDYVLGRCEEAKQPWVHTHPPTTCDEHLVPGGYISFQCKAGGIDAWLCAPSDVDRQSLEQRGAPFDVLQCDKNAFVFYFNPRYAPADSVLR